MSEVILPREIWALMFSYLAKRSILRSVSLVNKNFNQISSDVMRIKWKEAALNAKEVPCKETSFQQWREEDLDWLYIDDKGKNVTWASFVRWATKDNPDAVRLEEEHFEEYVCEHNTCARTCAICYAEYNKESCTVCVHCVRQKPGRLHSLVSLMRSTAVNQYASGRAILSDNSLCPEQKAAKICILWDNPVPGWSGDYDAEHEDEGSDCYCYSSEEYAYEYDIDMGEDSEEEHEEGPIYYNVCK